MELVVLATLLAAGLGMLGAIEWRERPAGPVQTLEVRFGADVTADAVEAMLTSISGLPARAAVALDVVADEAGIRFLLHGDQATLETLIGQWRGLLPSLRLEPADPAAIAWSGGAVLRGSGAHPVLRRDAVPESAAALLGALQPLGAGEVVLLRWGLAPGGRQRLSQPTSRRGGKRHPEGLLDALVHEAGLAGEHARLLRTKYGGPLVEGVGVVAVKAEHPQRAAHLTSRVVSVMRARRGAYGNLSTRSCSARRVARLLGWRHLRGSRFAPAELAGIVGLPINAPQVPGLVFATAPLLMPSPRIPSRGCVFGVSNWPGRMRPLAQPVLGAMSHTLLAGPSGVGKSNLASSIAAQHLKAGSGFLVVDGKGDLVEAILGQVPANRASDVIVLDLASREALPGLRLFGRGTDPETTAELVLSILADVFADSWGPLSRRWLRYGLLLLACDRQATLADLPFLFAPDGSYRRKLLARSDDVLVRNAFAGYEAMSPQERTHQLSAALGKVEEIVGSKVARAVLAQPKPAIDMGEVLRAGKVVLVSLAPGQVGAGVSRLIGGLVVFQLFAAVQARSALPESKRRPFHFLCDEPAVLGDMPAPIDSLYELGRGLGCGVLLSVQSLAQLRADVRAAATTNAATWVVFRQASADAKLLAPELRGVTAEELGSLAAFEAVFKIGLGPGDVAAPATGRTLPLPPATSDPQAIRRASAERYGTDPAEVEAAWRARHEQPAPAVPVGRTRRQS